MDEINSGIDKLCCACGQTIKVQATVCRYCRTQQNQSLLSSSGLVLTWIAGVIVVIALLIGLRALINLYLDRVNKISTVSELTGAAKFLAANKDYLPAWRFYQQALEIDASSERVRREQVDLAQQWLRYVTLQNSANVSYTDLAAQLLPVMYRGLTDATPQTVSQLYAHIAWANYLKSRNNVSMTDVDAQFHKALDLDKTNTYANVMRAFWLVFEKGAAAYDAAMEHFEIAAKWTDNSAFVRKWYLYALNLLLGEDESRSADVKKRILTTLNEMRLNNEPHPEQRIALDIIQTYGGGAVPGKYLDALMNVMPVDQHVQTLEWLAQGIDREHNLVYQYVMARLNEAMGDSKAALQNYQLLSEQKYTDPATVKIIDEGLKRVSIKPLPKLKPDRAYIDDPLPADDELWEFHKDTLLNFDFYNSPRNAQQALAYFSVQNKSLNYNGRYEELVAILDKARNRIKERLDNYQREIVPMPGEIKITNKMRRVAMDNLTQIWNAIGQFAIAQQDYDRAIAEFTDLTRLKFANDRDLWYQLSTSYSLRSLSDKTVVNSSKRKEKDIDEALGYLKKYVTVSAELGQKVDWKTIHADNNLNVLHNQVEYQKLAKGKL